MAAARARAAPPVIAVALISAAALAYEIVLMRLFSIILWHHFAYMIISLALLGYGASGALLSLAQRAVQQRIRFDSVRPGPKLRKRRAMPSLQHFGISFMQPELSREPTSRAGAHNELLAAQANLSSLGRFDNQCTRNPWRFL